MPDKITKAYLVASGDLRLAANRTCWPAQAEMEGRLGAAFAEEGVTLERAHPFDEAKGHGFVDAQRLGMDVFNIIPLDTPVVVAEAVWQYPNRRCPAAPRGRRCVSGGRVLL